MHGFSESIESKVEKGMKWESTIANSELWGKMIVCGRAPRWWDNETKE